MPKYRVRMERKIIVNLIVDAPDIASREVISHGVMAVADQRANNAARTTHRDGYNFMPDSVKCTNVETTDWLRTDVSEIHTIT